MSGRLIVLTGPAAVGKSTIARRLLKRLTRDGELWFVMELDGFGRGVHRDWIALPGHAGRFAERGFVYGPAASGGIGLIVGPDARRVFAAFHRSVAATVTSGINVICETVVYDDADRQDWSAALGDIDVTWVRLTAPIDELDAREQADRSRLFKGLGRGMSARPAIGTYDVVADTSAESADEIADSILEVER